MLSERDLRAIRSLRSLISGLSDSSGPDREILANYCREHMIAFLWVARSRWRFGFDRPFGEVVEEIADWEVAVLLRVGSDASGGPCFAHLRDGVSSCLGLGKAREDTVPTILATHDTPLAQALWKLLRMRAHQGAVHLWMREHPQEALLLRALKIRLRHSSGIRIQWDPRGQLVVSGDSDLRGPSLNQEELAGALRRSGAAFKPSEVVKALRPCLRPDGGHGGYCYFLDLVRVVHRIRVEFLEIDGSGTGAIPRDDGIRVTRSGLPMDMWVQKVREILEETAWQILANDGGDASAETRDVWVQIAMERTLRYWGMGDPSWEHLSQAKLIRHLLPDAGGATEFAKHQKTIDYLIRRLRGRIKHQGKRLAQPLWHRWIETTRSS